MPHRAALERLLHRIDGRSYPAYREIRRTWDLDTYELIVDHVQGDPFAAPSCMRVRAPTAVLPPLLNTSIARLATEDFLLRRFCDRLQSQRRGSGRSGEIRCLRPGPEVIERSALRIEADGTAEIRLTVGLPAAGRRILGREAWRLLSEDLPRACENLLSVEGLERHIASVSRQDELRNALQERGLIAFIEDGSILPRTSGTSEQPLKDAIPFTSPPSLQVTLNTSSGPVVGMGIPAGITLIVGGGFHGKSTLLNAIQRGHLNHKPGDGREGVVASDHTTKIRAEDGRRITGVDISWFLKDLPGGHNTSFFCTDDASGSTSQAAAIVEALESGSKTLLIDEDTSATNLLARDDRMRELIPDNQEPITPFVDRIRSLYSDLDVSTVMVIGGLGDYLPIADCVIALNHYRPKDVTQRARQIGAERTHGVQEVLRPPAPRVPLRQGLEPGKHTRARDARSVQYGDSELVLTAVEQVLDGRHAATIGQAIRFLHDEIIDGKRTIVRALDALEAMLDDEGVELLSPRHFPTGDLIRPRRQEIHAALSRLRSLQVAR